MNGAVPVILLSGMAADERLFAPQVDAFPNLRVQPWIAPRPGESIRQYAARLARLVNPGRPCVVGGASFGGVVALEMAWHLPALAVVLIGSVRSPAGLPRRWRMLWPVAWLGPEVLAALAAVAARLGRPLLKGGTVRRLRRLASPESAFARWAMCALARWRPGPAAPPVPVYHIHGADDRVLPVGRGRPDVVVPAGGHALSLFSPAAVNAFLTGVVHTVTSTRLPAEAAPR
ncbi:MAG TPA: alpha/beta hydrolase [Gemmataceae bacterium]|nr:alpha/beta hydrolase [Gemmataceae bacterium]